MGNLRYSKLGSLRYARLLGRAVEVLEGEEPARRWLTRAQYGLGGAIPLDYAETEAGAREVENVLGRIEFDESLVERLPHDRLPASWLEEMPARASRQVGDGWVRENRSAILAVPSAIIPEELNFLLNPMHPGFQRIAIGKPTPFTIEPRLRE